ncbi:unnamed protein product [Heligmosomoides polygyrus]|uniref:receptor protein serine/threonine kinase n=1 Tax=Heligmosomoides polygyrus TaxID=6339 RepID=A0A3P8BUR8_HELPZ|nr:unnamed protein product [Heligmosomoides polygyrus]
MMPFPASHASMTFIEALFAVLSLFVHTDVFAAPQENQLLNCIFSRASNLSDWEQLSNDIAKDAVNVTPVAGTWRRTSVRAQTRARAEIGCFNAHGTGIRLTCAAAWRTTATTSIGWSLVPSNDDDILVQKNFAAAVLERSYGEVYHSDQATFDNEYEILNLLQPLKHPNIIQLIRRVVTGNRLVLQLYSSSLHSLLDERPLTLTEFFDCALAVNDGLAFLHSHTNVNILGTVSKPVIAHRDLNPNNVLVSRTSNPSRLQLCIADFGLSVSFPEGRPTKDLELITERGTVRYMAGELIEGSVNLLDPMTSLLQTDVYSCALVMWEMLWRCRNVWPLGDFPPRPTKHSILCPRDLVELWSYISDMWEHEPEGRTTAACTADRLRRLRASMDPAGLETVS